MKTLQLQHVAIIIKVGEKLQLEYPNISKVNYAGLNQNAIMRIVENNKSKNDWDW